MKQFLTLLLFILCSTFTANAQNYLDHLKKKEPGKGVVTVNQSKAIDELVNGKPVQATEKKPTAQDDKTKTKTKTTPQPQKTPTDTQHKNTELPQRENTPTPQHENTKEGTHASNAKEGTHANNAKEGTHASNAKEGTHANNAAKAENKKEETEMPIVDMRKKVMRKSYKVTGYRVQVYAGGNSRNDRLKAEQTGNNIKMKFPDQPVYVHFYSPRWICRMGNFRSLGEAQKVLAKVKALGYRQACLVKGQITVQY